MGSTLADGGALRSFIAAQTPVIRHELSLLRSSIVGLYDNVTVLFLICGFVFEVLRDYHYEDGQDDAQERYQYKYDSFAAFA